MKINARWLILESGALAYVTLFPIIDLHMADLLFTQEMYSQNFYSSATGRNYAISDSTLHVNSRPGRAHEF